MTDSQQGVRVAWPSTSPWATLTITCGITTSGSAVQGGREPGLRRQSDARSSPHEGDIHRGADTFPVEVEGLLALARECGLSPALARVRMGFIADALAEWKMVALGNRILERKVSMKEEAVGPRLESLRTAAP